MNYKALFVPVGGAGLTRQVVEADGTVRQTVEGPVLTEAQAKSFASSLSNNSLVATAAVTNTVQPSTAQQAAILKYLTLIQSASNTSTVETAINAL